jgi:uncharacterized protein (TIGR00730 family)
LLSFCCSNQFMGKIERVAIFCGSKNGNNPLYTQHAEELAKILAEFRIELVYGGGKKGLMGTVADTVMKQSGIVRGVIPQVLVDWEHQHQGISELLVVDDMHIRKRKMYDLCDAAVILPGGFGTLDELFEIVTWNQLSLHDKKIFVLNSGGFYNHLLQHMRFVADEGFLWGKLNELMVILNEPADFLPFVNQ